MPIKSTKEDDRPSFQFYPTDWLTDTGLILSEPFEKGIWIDMLCYMFTSPIRGAMLNPDGSKMDVKSMAKLLRVSESVMKNVIGKLMANKVARRLDDGTIVNWRMYHKDKALSQKRREAGLKGAISKWEKEDDGKEDGKTMASGMANDGKDGSSEKKKNIEVDSLAVGSKHLYLEFVYLSLEEFKKLGDRFGKGGLDGYIERLDGYIGQIGEAAAKKKYVSHYHTILNWARKDEKEGKSGTNKAGGLQAADGKYAKAAADRASEVAEDKL